MSTIPSVVPDVPNPPVYQRPEAGSRPILYQVGDRVVVDRAVIEDHDQGTPGFTKHFKDLDNVEGTVVYIRTPFSWRGETRDEPVVGIQLDEIRGVYYYFPEELALIGRGVNTLQLAGLSKELQLLAEKFRSLTDG